MARVRGSRSGVETKIQLTYRDENEQETRRTVWPVAVAYYETVRLLAAWCELRGDFRHFRTDRVTEAEFLDERYPARRDILRSQVAAGNGARAGSLGRGDAGEHGAGGR